MTTSDSAKLVPAIMSGGSGTRLWPLSRKARPKQFHALTGEKSMLAETVARLDGELGAEMLQPVVICNVAHGDLATKALDEAGFEPGTAVLEPVGKDTAAAAALACHQALSQDQNALVLLLAADHHITKPKAFHDAIAKAVPLASEGRLVTFGIEPEGPETGFGYIKAGEPITNGFLIERFCEKPKLHEAEAYLAEGGYSWNSGSFLLNARHYLDELMRLRPDIAEPVAAAWKSAEIAGRLITPGREDWDRTAKQSIDYAVAEKTEGGAVVPVSMGWSDVGSWAAIHELAEKDAAGNAAEGDVVLVDTKGCLIKGTDKRVIAVAGCEDLLIVDTGDALFVAPKKDSQKVKDLVAALKENGFDSLL